MPAPDLTPLHVFYLHGFASSPQSTKVGYFSERLREHSVDVRCPDFNQPDFATLTITRMLDQLGAELAQLAGAPATLFGSSLGGTLAILAAERFAARIDRKNRGGVIDGISAVFKLPNRAGHTDCARERVEIGLSACYADKRHIEIFHIGLHGVRIVPLSIDGNKNHSRTLRRGKTVKRLVHRREKCEGRWAHIAAIREAEEQQTPVTHQAAVVKDLTVLIEQRENRQRSRRLQYCAGLQSYGRRSGAENLPRKECAGESRYNGDRCKEN